jgi:hypothetical protein
LFGSGIPGHAKDITKTWPRSNSIDMDHCMEWLDMAGYFIFIDVGTVKDMNMNEQTRQNMVIIKDKDLDMGFL